jgi:hypothetical protein
MDGNIEQCVCIQLYVKLNKSATKTLEMLHEAFGEYSLTGQWFLNGINVKASQVSVDGNEC